MTYLKPDMLVLASVSVAIEASGDDDKQRHVIVESLGIRTTANAYEVDE